MNNPAPETAPEMATAADIARALRLFDQKGRDSSQWSRDAEGRLLLEKGRFVLCVCPD